LPSVDAAISSGSTSSPDDGRSLSLSKGTFHKLPSASSGNDDKTSSGNDDKTSSGNDDKTSSGNSGKLKQRMN